MFNLTIGQGLGKIDNAALMAFGLGHADITGFYWAYNGVLSVKMESSVFIVVGYTYPGRIDISLQVSAKSTQDWFYQGDTVVILLPSGEGLIAEKRLRWFSYDLVLSKSRIVADVIRSRVEGLTRTTRQKLDATTVNKNQPMPTARNGGKIDDTVITKEESSDVEVGP